MPADPKAIAERVIVSRDNAASCPTADVDTLARAYLALLPPAGAWSHDEGDVVLTHPDGSTERFYAGERAPFIVAACSRYEALVSDLPHAVETCGCPVLRAWPAAHTEAVERLRALGGGSP